MSATVDFRFEGTDALLEQLRALGRKGTKAAEGALRKAAEPIMTQAQANARSKLREKSHKGIPGLKVGRVFKQGGVTKILIGIDKGDISEIYYMKFHEFGTSHEPPRPSLLPAFDEKKEEAYEILYRDLKEAVKP